MHHPGFAIIVWSIDILSVLALLRLVYMMSTVVRLLIVGDRYGVRFRRTPRLWWLGYGEVVLALVANTGATFGGIGIAYFLFGAPRWLHFL